MPRAKEIFPHAILGTRKDYDSPGTDGAMSRGPYQWGGGSRQQRLVFVIILKLIFGFRFLSLQEIASFPPLVS